MAIAEWQGRSISLARSSVHTLAASLPLVGLMLAAYHALSPIDGVSAAILRRTPAGRRCAV